MRRDGDTTHYSLSDLGMNPRGHERVGFTGFYEFGRALTLEVLYRTWLLQFDREPGRDNFLVAMNNLAFPRLRYIDPHAEATVCLS